MTAALKMERFLSASPATCFDLWSNRQELGAWWGPKDDNREPFRADIIEWDVREGAPWRINMTAPDGTIYRQRGEIIEVDPPFLIRFSFQWIENGKPGPRTEIAVRFEQEGNGTRFSFSQTGLANEAERVGHWAGWNECLDRFEQMAKREVAAS